MNNQNLRPFKPGQSGNPNGRPKKTPLEKTMESALADRNLRASLVQSLIAHAQRGNIQAMKLLLRCTPEEGDEPSKLN